MLTRPNLSLLPLAADAFRVLSQKALPDPSSWRWTPMIPPNSVKVLLSHLEEVRADPRAATHPVCPDASVPLRFSFSFLFFPLALFKSLSGETQGLAGSCGAAEDMGPLWERRCSPLLRAGVCKRGCCAVGLEEGRGEDQSPRKRACRGLWQEAGQRSCKPTVQPLTMEPAEGAKG